MEVSSLNVDKVGQEKKEKQVKGTECSSSIENDILHDHKKCILLEQRHPIASFTTVQYYQDKSSLRGLPANPSLDIYTSHGMAFQQRGG